MTDAILYMLVDSADKLKLMTVLDFPSNNISDESIGRPCTVKKEEKIFILYKEIPKGSGAKSYYDLRPPNI